MKRSLSKKGIKSLVLALLKGKKLTTITSAITGIGEDVILDYIDIINNKKVAPDSFQNAVKIN